jgi:hypothetical protein
MIKHDPDLFLKIGICGSYGRQYSGEITEIERSTSPSIPANVDLFTLVIEPPNCQCQPRCKIDAIALHYNGVCAFLSELYYDRTETATENIRKMANAAKQ